jgi:hypothetical protein
MQKFDHKLCVFLEKRHFFRRILPKIEIITSTPGKNGFRTFLIRSIFNVILCMPGANPTTFDFTATTLAL